MSFMSCQKNRIQQKTKIMMILLFLQLFILKQSFADKIEKAIIQDVVIQENFNLFTVLESASIMLNNSPNKTLESLVYIINSIAENYYGRPNSNGVHYSFYHVELFYDSGIRNRLFDLQILPSGDRHQLTIAFKVSPIVKSNPILRLMMVSYLSTLFSLNQMTAYDLQSSRTMNLNQALNYLGFKPKYFKGYLLQFLELYVNAEKGSVYSQLELLRIQNEILQNVKENIDKDYLSHYIQSSDIANVTKEVSMFYQLPLVSSVGELFAQLSLQVSNKLNNLTTQSKLQYKQQKELYDSKKDLRHALDEQYRLSQLIKSGDRQKVYEVLNQLIPWPLLEPTEVYLWQQFLDSIRQPNWKQAVLMYRGIDSKEKLQFNVNTFDQLENIAMLSKRLTAGSGSHIYKLFGLPGTFEQTGVLGNSKEFRPYESPHGNFNMMMNHARDPRGSMYISATFSPYVAENFAEKSRLYVKSENDVEKMMKDFRLSNKSGGIASLLIDPRRFLVNSFSSYTLEVEVLIPLIVFPDEILHLEKATDVSIYKLIDPNKEVSTDNIMYLEHRKIPLKDFVLKSIDKYEQRTGQQYPNYANLTEIIKNNKIDPFTEGNSLFRLGVSQLNELFIKTQNRKVMFCDRIFY